MRQEQVWFDKTVVDVFGFNAVQIGLPQLHCLRENRMPMRALLTHADQSLGAQSTLSVAPTWHVIEGLPDELPFAAESVDLPVSYTHLTLPTKRIV